MYSFDFNQRERDLIVLGLRCAFDFMLQDIDEQSECSCFEAVDEDRLVINDLKSLYKRFNGSVTDEELAFLAGEIS